MTRGPELFHAFGRQAEALADFRANAERFSICRSRLSAGCVGAGISVLHGIARDAFQSPSKRCQCRVGRNQLLKQDRQIMRFLNGQAMLGQKALEVFLNRLLTMKANFIVEKRPGLEELASRRGVVFGFSHPQARDLFS
jgi:hypothetical protein